MLGKRILSILIDFFILFYAFPFLFIHLFAWEASIGLISEQFITTSYGFFVILFTHVALYLLIYLVFTAQTRYSIGKLICGLRIYNTQYSKKNFKMRIILREVCKLLVLLFGPIGLGFTLYNYYKTGTTWYDRRFGTDIEDSRQLTETQKNWRKTYNQ